MDNIISTLHFLSSQIINFVDDVPALQERVNTVSYSFQLWIKQNTSVTLLRQNQYISDTVSDLKYNILRYIEFALAALTDILAYFALIPIYTFLILYYRRNIKKFLIIMFQNYSKANVTDILTEATTISQQYIVGLFIFTL